MTNRHIPLYAQIKNYVIDKIKEGSYETGDKIPSEMKFREKFGVSSTTVVKALNDLVAEGYIERRQGKGSFVLSPKLTRNFLNLGITEEFRKQGIELKTNLLEIKKVKEPEISEKLKLDSTIPFFKIVRQRYIVSNNVVEPVALQTSYIASNIITEEDLKLLEVNNSLYDVLHKSQEIIPYTAKEIVNVQLIKEKKVAHLLEEEEGDPVLFVERITYNQDGNAFEYAESSFKWNRYNLEVELRLKDQK